MDSDSRLANAVVGIIGLGGGGSHVVQQLAHIGIGHFALFDPDSIDPEGTNLNRLVGATKIDVRVGTPKAAIAGRVVLSVRGNTGINEAIHS